jgi:hypothetical protein
MKFTLLETLRNTSKYSHRYGVRNNRHLITAILENCNRTEGDNFSSGALRGQDLRGCIQKFPDCVDNEVNNDNKHSSRSDTKCYGGKTH